MKEKLLNTLKDLSSSETATAPEVQTAAPQGFFKREVPGDGDCLLYAVLELVFSPIIIQNEELRQARIKVADFLGTHYPSNDILRGVLLTEAQTHFKVESGDHELIKSYLDDTKNAGVILGHSVIFALSSIYGVNIHVRSYKDVAGFFNVYSYQDDEFAKTINILFSGGMLGNFSILEESPRAVNDAPVILTREVELQELSLERIEARVSQLSTLKGILRTIMDRESTEDLIISRLQKLEDLKASVEDHYKDLLKLLAHEKIVGDPIPDRVKRLIEVFKALGELYISKGELSSNPEHYTDAAKFYQYAISISEDELRKKEREDQIVVDADRQLILNDKKDAYLALGKIKEELINAIKVGSVKEDLAVPDTYITPAVVGVEEEINKDKLFLEELRERCEVELKEIDSYLLESAGSGVSEHERDQIFINRSRELFENVISENFKELLARITDESAKIIGKAPCEYSVIALGSLALKQATPYSDLEFAILTENEDYKTEHDVRVRQYFTNLAHLMHFRVINLGETIIPTSKYDIDLSHLIKVGVNFDLGGKTPLGRIDKDKPYSLIQTVEGMVHYLKNTEDGSVHRDKALPWILETCVHIHGEEALSQNYIAQARDFLHSKDKDDKSHCEARALRRLTQESIEQDYLSISKPGKLSANMDAYRPKLMTPGVEGSLLDVKQEIYRITDRLMYDLAFYHQILPLSIWDSIEQLKIKGVIGGEGEGSEAPSRLLYAASFAAIMRLKTYLANGSQKEDISVFASEKVSMEQVSRAFHLKSHELEIGAGLFKFFYTAIPIHRALAVFCRAELDGGSGCILNERFFDNAHYSTGKILLRLQRYDEARKSLEEAYRSEPSSLEILGALSHTLEMLDDPNAIELTKEAIEESEKQNNFESLVISHNRLVILYQKHSEIDLAIAENQHLLSLFEKEYRKSDGRYAIPENMILSFYNARINAALIFRRDGDSRGEIKYLQECLDFQQIDDINKLSILTRIAQAYKQLGEYKEAGEFYNKSLELSIRMYSMDHTSTATSFRELAAYYIEVGQPKEAKQNIQKAIQIRQLAYGDKHPELASALQIYALALEGEDEFDEAIDYHKKALDIYLSVYGLQHERVSDIYTNLGVLYYKRQGYKEAERQFNQALESIPRGLSDSYLLADIQANLGQCLLHNKKLLEAKKMLDKAQVQYAELEKSGNLNMSDKARVLNSFGDYFRLKGDNNLAIKYYEQSKDTYKGISNDQNALYIKDILKRLNTLGGLYTQETNYMLAEERLKEAKEIIDKGRSRIKDAYIAETYKELGRLYNRQKKYDDAIESLNKALEKTAEQEVGGRAEIYMLLRNSFFLKRDFEQSRKYSLKSYVIYKALGNNKDLILALDNLGADYRFSGSYQEALLKYREVRELKLEKFGDELQSGGMTYSEIISQTEMLAEIQEKILNKFRTIKQKHKDSEIEIEVQITPEPLELVKTYCEEVLGLSERDLEIEDNNYSITLNSDSLKSLERISEDLSRSIQEPVAGTLAEKPSASFWSKYYVEGIDKLLSLRLVGTGAMVYSTIMVHERILPTTNVNISLSKPIIVLPIVYSSLSKPSHAVGVIIRANGDSHYQLTYIDPENNPIKEEIVAVAQRKLPINSSISIEQKYVKEQSHSNNCGPELIEHIAHELTGFRVPEEQVAEFHSRLLEQHLIGSAKSIQRVVALNSAVTRTDIENTVHTTTDTRPILYLKTLEKMNAIVLKEAALDPFYMPFMNLVSSISKVPTVLLDAWHWGGKIMSQIQSMVEGVVPELQTDTQAARISFLFELLDHVRSGGGMPIPYFPHKPDTDPDDWGNGGGGGEKQHPRNEFGFGMVYGMTADSSYNLTNATDNTENSNITIIGDYNDATEQ